MKITPIQHALDCEACDAEERMREHLLARDWFRAAKELNRMEQLRKLSIKVAQRCDKWRADTERFITEAREIAAQFRSKGDEEKAAEYECRAVNAAEGELTDWARSEDPVDPNA